MQDKQLGKCGPTVSAIGLGCMGMSGMYGPADRIESLATIHSALERGVTLFDSGDFYGMGHNELLLNQALSECRRERFLLSMRTKQSKETGGFLPLVSSPEILNVTWKSLKSYARWRKRGVFL